MMSRLMNEVMPLLRLQDEVSRAFEPFFADTSAGRRYGAAYPALNVWEEADGNVAHVEAELPGMSIDDLDVSVLGNEVTIAGERHIGEQPATDEQAKSDGITWHRRERGQGKFSRTLTLPWEIDAERVEAHFRDGILDVTLPKAESAKPKKVKLLT